MFSKPVCALNSNDLPHSMWMVATQIQLWTSALWAQNCPRSSHLGPHTPFPSNGAHECIP